MLGPAIVNRHHKRNRFLIAMFMWQACAQPFLSRIDPYIAAALIFSLNLPFALYAYGAASNRFWYYLAYISFLALFINIVMSIAYHYMHIDQLDPNSYLFYRDKTDTAMIAIALIQTYLVIKVTNGYRGDIRQFIRDAIVRARFDIGRAKLVLRGIRVVDEDI